jgi:hypothetical protein
MITKLIFLKELSIIKVKTITKKREGETVIKPVLRV